MALALVFEEKRHCDISELFIQCNKCCCYEHITVVGANIYLYGCVSLLAPECAVCLCVCVCRCVFVCEIKSEHQQKTTCVSKLDALLHKTHIKVLWLNMCTSMISLSKIAHQMWQDCPFSQRNKKTMSSGVGGSR